MAKVTEANIPGVFLIEGHVFRDNRGLIAKSLSDDVLPGFSAHEIYYTSSKKNVIRGMHYQLPPFEQKKLIYVSKGRIMDVVFDIRRDSPTFGQFASFILEEGDGRALFVPPGIAHGNLTQTEEALIHYVQEGFYSPEAERGIHYLSFGFNWNVTEPLLSAKDLKLPVFREQD